MTTDQWETQAGCIKALEQGWNDQRGGKPCNPTYHEDDYLYGWYVDGYNQAVKLSAGQTYLQLIVQLSPSITTRFTVRMDQEDGIWRAKRLT